MQPHDRVLGRGYEARHQQSLPTRDRRRANVFRIALKTFVGEVVMKNEEFAPLHRAAMKKGCTVQIGTALLCAMVPATLQCLGLGTSTPEE